MATLEIDIDDLVAWHPSKQQWLRPAVFAPIPVTSYRPFFLLRATSTDEDHLDGFPQLVKQAEHFPNGKGKARDTDIV